MIMYTCIELYSAIIRKLSTRYQKTPEQIFFAFMRSQGVTFLTGTTSATHMLEDLEASEDIVLTETEIDDIVKKLT